MSKLSKGIEAAVSKDCLLIIRTVEEKSRVEGEHRVAHLSSQLKNLLKFGSILLERVEEVQAVIVFLFLAGELISVVYSLLQGFLAEQLPVLLRIDLRADLEGELEVACLNSQCELFLWTLCHFHSS